MVTHPLLDDTIHAVATPAGTGAVAIVRISGPDARRMAEGVLHRAPPWRPRHAHLVRLRWGDEAIAIWFRAPHSFTGEDVVEIQCTGSGIVVDNILKSLEKLGSRPAGPGEFSYRAVINGRMTLEEAERLNATINARSTRELEVISSTPSLEPRLRRLLSLALEVVADLEADIEFGEESSPALEELRQTIDSLVVQGELTARASAVPTVVLAGPPNCGKSTLFNAIVGYERAIVSSVPGTTRDYIEAEIRHRGIAFRLVDTAGTRSADDEIEAMGIEMTERLIRSADVVVSFVPTDDPRAIPVTPKVDLGVPPAPGTIGISGVTGEGVGRLLDAITDRLEEGLYSAWKEWIPQRAYGLVVELKKLVDAALAEELPELRSHHLMELTERVRGYLEADPVDLYGTIFSRFCIGK